MLNGLFIEGTSSGVGKTTIISGLVSLLAQRSIDVAVMKPIQINCPLVDYEFEFESSCMPDKEEFESYSRLSHIAGSIPSSLLGKTPQSFLKASDAQYLLQFINRNDPVDVVSPYLFATHLEPAVVSRLRDTPIDIEHIIGCFNQLRRASDIILVEGCCGLMSPLNDNHLMIDLISKLGLAVLLVVPSEIGVINSCLLTIEVLRIRELPIAGIILNRLTQDILPEEAANPYHIEKHQGSLIRGVLPFLKDKELSNPVILAKYMTRSIDLEMLFDNHIL